MVNKGNFHATIHSSIVQFFFHHFFFSHFFHIADTIREQKKRQKCIDENLSEDDNGIGNGNQLN